MTWLSKKTRSRTWPRRTATGFMCGLRNIFAWLGASSLPWILICAALGGWVAYTLVRVVSETCFDAMRHWDGIKRVWIPGHAKIWGIRVSGEVCKDLGTSPPWLLVSSVTAAPSVLLTWYWRDRKRRSDERVAREERDIARAQHALDSEIAFATRYREAAEMLGARKVMTRINGLETLFDLARQAPSQRAKVYETLGAFIQTQASLPRPKSIADVTQSLLGAERRRAEMIFEPTPKADVVTAVKRATASEWRLWDRVEFPKPWWRLDLRNTNLRRVELDAPYLRGAQLDRCTLEGAGLESADLISASLRGAQLQRAILVSASLNGASLRHASLEGAVLINADLSSADLHKARLEGADLRGIRYEDANFSDARYDAETVFPDGFGDPNERGMKRVELLEDAPP